MEGNRVEAILAELKQAMVAGHDHYGEMHRELGAKGQYADLHRKLGVLKRVIWEGHDTTREPLREIAMDMMAHLVMLIDVLPLEVDINVCECGHLACFHINPVGLCTVRSCVCMRLRPRD